MGATNQPNKQMKKLINRLKVEYPGVNFELGDRFTWSPEHQTVFYKASTPADIVDSWSLLHEVGHAILKHNNYKTDFELVQMEAAAWQKALALSKKYEVKIDQDHVQDCLDTYRDWLHKRSLCPECSLSSLQIDEKTYKCLNCSAQWQVSKSKLCRSYRRKTLVDSSLQLVVE